MSSAPATGWLWSMRRTNSSTGGQLEQPSEVKSSRRMGTRGWSGEFAGWLAAKEGWRVRARVSMRDDQAAIRGRDEREERISPGQVGAQQCCARTRDCLEFRFEFIGTTRNCALA